MQVRRVTPNLSEAWLIAEHARRKTIIIGGRPSMEGWTAANRAAGIRPRDGASDGTAPRMGYDRHYLFRRNAGTVLAGNRPASNFAAQNEFRRCAFRRWCRCDRFVLHGFAPTEHRLHPAHILVCLAIKVVGHTLYDFLGQ